MEISTSLTGLVITFMNVLLSVRLGQGSLMKDMFELVGESLNATNAERECQGKGCDGLAVISTPEEFNYLIHASEELRKSWGLWVALRYDLDLNKLLWNDGTEPAPNMPWLTNHPKLNGDVLCNRIHVSGKMGSLGCHHRRYYICGPRTKTYIEASGTVHKSTRPNNITSTLAWLQAASVTQCAVHCSREKRCSTALFEKMSLACHLIGWEGYSGLINSTPDQHTFVREGYLGYS